MCKQVVTYGLYCDEDCQSLDSFRKNQWSGANIALVGIMITFIAAMMILIVAKHRDANKNAEKPASTRKRP